MDAFFSELKFQDIQQIPGYSVGDLFSDIGGFMGLLLGGSLLTVCELLDLLFYNLGHKVRCECRVCELLSAQVGCS